jgi:hypothetical protein
MHLGLSCALSLGALLIGILGGLYFFCEWLRHKHASAFFWALGLFCLFLFQIPAILGDAGVRFVLTQFNLFFAVSFPISFFGLIMIYFGILSLTEPFPRNAYLVFSVWFSASLLFFTKYFFLNQTVTSHWPLYGAILLFFLPVHILNLWALFSFSIANQCPRNCPYMLGITALTLSLLCGIGRNIVLLKWFATYPPAFWFLALQPEILFWLQISGSVLLLAGFLLLHRYLKAGPRTSPPNPEARPMS